MLEHIKNKTNSELLLILDNIEDISECIEIADYLKNNGYKISEKFYNKVKILEKNTQIQTQTDLLNVPVYLYIYTDNPDDDGFIFDTLIDFKDVEIGSAAQTKEGRSNILKFNTISTLIDFCYVLNSGDLKVNNIEIEFVNNSNIPKYKDNIENIISLKPIELINKIQGNTHYKDYSNLSQKEITSLIDDALDAKDFDTVDTLSKYLKESLDINKYKKLLENMKKINEDLEISSDTDAYTKYIKGMEELTKQYGYAVKVIGGILQNVNSVEYSNDLESGDIIPTNITYKDGSVSEGVYSMHDNYTNLEEFLSYDEMYNISGRLGYNSPEEAWNDNPIYVVDTDPSKMRIATEEEKAEYLKLDESKKPFDLNNWNLFENFTPQSLEYDEITLEYLINNDSTLKYLNTTLNPGLDYMFNNYIKTDIKLMERYNQYDKYTNQLSDVYIKNDSIAQEISNCFSANEGFLDKLPSKAIEFITKKIKDILPNIKQKFTLLSPDVKQNLKDVFGGKSLSEITKMLSQVDGDLVKESKVDWYKVLGLSSGSAGFISLIVNFVSSIGFNHLLGGVKYNNYIVVACVGLLILGVLGMVNSKDEPIKK